MNSAGSMAASIDAFGISETTQNTEFNPSKITLTCG